ncbi:MAG: hypothetical protein GX621_17680 [Pirellulaceae bacterium]|nr:hypothetical protein [Pirellulaceae bacterium]
MAGNVADASHWPPPPLIVPRLEHDRALQKVVISMLADHTELFRHFSDNPGFKKWLSDTIFGVTYEEPAA